MVKLEKDRQRLNDLFLELTNFMKEIVKNISNKTELHYILEEDYSVCILYSNNKKESLNCDNSLVKWWRIRILSWDLRPRYDYHAIYKKF